MRHSALVIPALVLGDCVGAKAQQGATRVTSVEGITEYHLPNGLRVLLFPDQSKPTVTVNVTYMVGSRHEGYGETGMAHLLEHMQFKATATRHDIPVEMDKHGARWSASTWLDRTNYFLTMTSSRENLDWALALEADRMTRSLIAEKDRASEMTVVRNEFEAGENDPFSILLERTIFTAYLWHNYGHSTIGARSDIENVPIERLQAIYHKYYEPDNAGRLHRGRKCARLAARESRSAEGGDQLRRWLLHVGTRAGHQRRVGGVGDLRSGKRRTSVAGLRRGDGACARGRSDGRGAFQGEGRLAAGGRAGALLMRSTAIA